MNLDKHVLTAGLSYEHQYVGNSFMLAVWDITVTTALRTSEMEQHLLYTL